MDVVNTNHTESKASRRRRDQHENWHRALEWSQRRGDILVHPHSPLAIADILTQSGARLDLVPDAIGLPDPEACDTVAPLRRTKPPKKHRSKANLLTRHSQEELYDLCKEVQVINALVKQPGEHRLYVAAGFIQSHKSAKQRLEAPLLLFPAILSRKTGDDVNATRCYELRMDSCTPDINLELIDVIADSWDIRLPEFKAGESLANWFASVAGALQGSDELTLHFDIAVGTASPPKHITVHADGTPWFPELPDHFDAPLAMAIAQSLSLSQLTAVMQLIGQPDNDEASWVAADAANDTKTPIAEIHQLARRLADVGLERVEFRHIDDLPTRLHEWADCVREAMKNATLAKLGDTGSLTALQFVRVSSMVELIDREPKEFKQYMHPHLAYQSTRALLRRAHHQARLIKQELQDLQNYFHLERIPSKKQLLSLIEELGGHNVSEPDVVDADYFNARRQFMEFSVDKPANLTIEHRRLLSQLAKVIRFRELFVTNSEYRQALGPGYKGLQTNWSELEAMIQYAIDISDHLESESVAAQFLTHWASARTLYVDDFEHLQTAADALRKLLRVVGTSHRHTPLDKLVTNATVLADNLQGWRAPELDLSAYSTKSAANILASFSGMPRTDSRTEAAVADTEQRIRQHLQRRKTKPEAIVDTITWLLQASETAARQSLNIDAIVNRLNIA